MKQRLLVMFNFTKVMKTFRKHSTYCC